jgi:HKD family nuclease
MESKIMIFPPFSSIESSFESEIGRMLDLAECRRISVAVAYSSVAGVTRLHEMAEAKSPKTSFRWLLGIDDYVTQPGAIKFCQSLPRSTVKIYSTKKAGSRFHPKYYLFEASSKSHQAVTILGSSNLTRAALRTNCEANALLRASNRNESTMMENEFLKLWDLGTAPTEKLLRNYEEKYRKYLSQRKFLQDSVLETKNNKKTKEVLESDSAQLGAESATVCWIEVGKATAQGRELEFKAEQARYFGLAPGGGVPSMQNFLVSDGSTTQLRLKYQGNSMWRLQLKNSVPEVTQGLRPMVNGKLGRSPLVAVFRRISGSNAFRLSFLPSDSMEFSKLKNRSTELGTVGHTPTRFYGWC